MEGASEVQAEEGAQELDPVQVQHRSWDPDLEFVIKTPKMFEFGSLQEAMSRGGIPPTTTKSVDLTRKDDDGREFARCQLVPRDVKPKQEETDGRLRREESARQSPV